MLMTAPNLSGNGVALVTPFNPDFSIDFTALENIINHIVNGKADFIVVLGTTGEAAVLSLEEKLRLIAFVKKTVGGRLPLVLGYGGISTAELVTGFHRYDFEGIEAILSVTPFYVKPSQEGLRRHYTAIADASPRPVILYNVPGRTGVNILPETTLALAEHPNIIGVKEASGKLFQIEEILMNKPDDFLLFSGDDALTYHLMGLGADGVISVMANAFPAEITAIVNGSAGDAAVASKARSTHFDLKWLTKAVFADGNPCGIKYVLSRLGLCNNVLRLPLVPVSDRTAEEIDRLLSSLDSVE